MKNILVLFFALCLTASGYTQEPVISGKITGRAASAVNEVQLYYDGKSHSIKVNKEDQTFKAELKLQEPQFIELKSGSSNSSFFYAAPGEEVALELEKITLNETVVTIKGERIRKLNSVMDRFYSSLQESGINTLAREWHTELFTRPEIASKAIQEANKVLENNEQFFNEAAPGFRNDFTLFSTAFMNFIKADILSGEEIELILEELSKTEIKTTALTIPYFRQFLVDITNAYAARKLESYDMVLEFINEGYKSKMIAAEACVKYIPNESVRYYLFFDKLNTELAGSGIKHRKYVDYLFANADQKTKEALQKRFESVLTSAQEIDKKEKVPAKDFEFRDRDGKIYRLADFKGKMLLIDFWASWCAPCKVQMPHLKDLEKHYEGKDIVVVKVSLDNTKEAWLKGVESEDLKGILLHAEGAFRNPFPVAYGITSIPRFMLIDADGNIVSDDMPKPQFKDQVMAIIDKELYRNEVEKIMSSHLTALGAEKLLNGNGYRTVAKQSMMGIGVDLNTWYSYPKNLRFDFTPSENPTFLLALGEDFFRQRYMIVKEDTVFGTIAAIDEAAASWTNKLYGLDLFLAKYVEKATIEFAEENFTNSENMYVLRATKGTRTVRYFIDKDDFLIKKAMETHLVKPRQGGGVLEAPVKYDDYREVNGVKIPHLINTNNIVIIKVTEAEIKPLDSKVFSSPEN